MKLYTIDEVAEYLRVTRRTIYRYIEQGKLPAYRVGDSWRFSDEDISEYLKKNRKSTSANNH